MKDLRETLKKMQKLPLYTSNESSCINRLNELQDIMGVLVEKLIEKERQEADDAYWKMHRDDY